MKFITIDPYYNNQFYNEAKEALKNNKIDFKEFVSIKAPYNFYFGIDDSLTPLMVNYDEATASDKRWLVNLVTPIQPVDEYLLLRRESDNSSNAIRRFIENEPLKQAHDSDYACFFNIRSKSQIQEITRTYPFRVWYMGRYYGKRYRLGLTFNENIKNFIPSEDILLEKIGNEYNEVGRFEAMLNYKVFLMKDRLIKYSMTPYIENGIYVKTNYKTYEILN